MAWLRVVGAVFTAVGLAAYLLGVGSPVTGRALSLPAVMVGLTLVAIGGEE
jgi:hypothetical protein